MHGGNLEISRDLNNCYKVPSFLFVSNKVDIWTRKTESLEH